MRSRRPTPNLTRRALLGSIAAGGAGLYLRPLLAQEAGAAPARLLIVHRPCGSRPEQFFPSGGETDFTLTPVLEPFAALRAEMLVLGGVNCPRDPGWPGDQHAAGLITMMTGKRFMEIPGTDAAGDPNAKNIVGADQSVDQLLLE